LDAVVIGSGYGGAVVAARLAEAGMSVALLERGPRLATGDLRQSDDPRYLKKVVDVVISSSNVAYRTGKVVGGASLPMDGAHFRMPQKSFEARDANGRRYWPEVYSRAALDPYYQRAEAMLQIRQRAWDEVPKAGGLFAKMLAQAGASCERAPMNYAGCLQCGFCAAGCIFDRKKTVLHTYIPLAESHGAVVHAGAKVQRVEPAGTAYRVLYEQGGEAKELSATRVVIAGGGLHTPALLLRSAPQLPGLSAQVGENFNNNGEHGFVGVLPEGFDDLARYRCYQGMENGGVMTFHWFESDGFTLHPGAGTEPSILVARLAATGHAVLPGRAWGLEYKRFAETVYPHRLIAFSSLGLADGHGAVALAGDGSPDVVRRSRAGYDAYLDRLEAIVAEVGRRTGVTIVPAVPHELAGSSSAHLLSSPHGRLEGDRRGGRGLRGVRVREPVLLRRERAAVCTGREPSFDHRRGGRARGGADGGEGMSGDGIDRREFLRRAGLALGALAWRCTPRPEGCELPAFDALPQGDASGLPHLGGAPAGHEGRVIAAFVDTIVPGRHRDPKGAPGGIDVGAPGLFFDPALEAGPLVAVVVELLDLQARDLFEGRNFDALAVAEREEVIEATLKSVASFELAVQFAKLTYFSSPAAGCHLGYPGANPGYRDDPDYSFRKPMSEEITSDGNLP
jgi:hypothetical protein